MIKELSKNPLVFLFGKTLQRLRKHWKGDSVGSAAEEIEGVSESTYRAIEAGRTIFQTRYASDLKTYMGGLISYDGLAIYLQTCQTLSQKTRHDQKNKPYYDGEELVEEIDKFIQMAEEEKRSIYGKLTSVMEPIKNYIKDYNSEDLFFEHIKAKNKLSDSLMDFLQNPDLPLSADRMETVIKRTFFTIPSFYIGHLASYLQELNSFNAYLNKSLYKDWEERHMNRIVRIRGVVRDIGLTIESLFNDFTTPTGEDMPPMAYLANETFEDFSVIFLGDKHKTPNVDHDIIAENGSLNLEVASNLLTEKVAKRISRSSDEITSPIFLNAGNHPEFDEHAKDLLQWAERGGDASADSWNNLWIFTLNYPLGKSLPSGQDSITLDVGFVDDYEGGENSYAYCLDYNAIKDADKMFNSLQREIKSKKDKEWGKLKL